MAISSSRFTLTEIIVLKKGSTMEYDRVGTCPNERWWGEGLESRPCAQPNTILEEGWKVNVPASDKRQE